MKNLLSLTFILSIALSATAQCDFGEHSIDWQDAWVSCSVSDNPNPERGQSHWIMYDLGSPHLFFESWVWNYNVPNDTGQGARNCYFDFSLDGTNWTEWGTQEIEEAPGSVQYTGVPGPYFDGAVGRYLLITIDTNWDGTGCRGFSEIRVDIEETTVDIEEVSAKIDFNIYPNPVDDQLTIRHYANGNMDVSVMDASGRVVYQQQMFGTTSYVNVSDWEGGLYFVVLQDEDGNTSTQRLVVR